MNLFSTLNDIANSSELLDDYLLKNMQIVNDFNALIFSEVHKHKDDIDKFILSKRSIIEGLNCKNTYNIAFISILLELCERLNLWSAIQIIAYIVKNKGILVSYRLQATLLYFYEIDCNSRFIERYEAICLALQKSYDCDEESENKIIFTFLNYYATIVLNTTTPIVDKIKSKILNSLSQNAFKYLDNQYISQALSLNIADPKTSYDSIQEIIDAVLYKTTYSISSKTNQELLIEEHTPYSLKVLTTKKSFKAIRQISVDYYRKLDNKSTIFQSLDHGKALLDNEEQLFCYMNSYGNTHHAKLLSALEHLPFSSITSETEILDWGCGQGLGTIVFYDYTKTNSIRMSPSSVNLIEGSILSLKRAALHVKTFDEKVGISTINKEFDSLDVKDIICKPLSTKIHLFLNILDLDTFSIAQLINLLKSSCKGMNYFICVSPYVTCQRTERVDSFSRYFKNNYKTYCSLFEIESRGRQTDEYWDCNNRYNSNSCYNHHPHYGCDKKWTRVIRVFKVEL